MEFENVRIVSADKITKTVKELFIRANYYLPSGVCDNISRCKSEERSPVAKEVLGTILENIDAAAKYDVPICQDTGMAVTFVDIGLGVFIDGDLNKAVNEGVKLAYNEGYLRKSIVRDPFYDRVNTEDNTPALIHIRFVSDPEMVGKIKITAAPKGFGSENMSNLKMLTPSATEEDIVDFVVDCVRTAGANPCPPIVVGVGIGANFEGSALLAKRALLRDTESSDENYAALEKKLLERINSLDIGPQGFGGDTTALAVRVESAPTHIAGLPVAVNINCHVSRHMSEVI